MPNLRELKPSRRKPVEGDLFAMKLADGRYLFGRVVNTNAQALPPLGGAILIYIYRPTFTSMSEPDRSLLTPRELLVPPLMTNRLPWSKGFFQTVANWPLEAEDVLPQHSFLSTLGRYYDENGNELAGPSEPVGDHGLHSYRTIDDQISDALMLSRASD